MMEGPGNITPKVEKESRIEQEITREEAVLKNNVLSMDEWSKKLAQAKEKSSSDNEFNALFGEVGKSVDELCRDIDVKLKDRLESWSVTTAGLGAAAGAVFLGNPGGMEGIGLGVLHGVESGVAAATVATAIWAVNHLNVGIKRWHEGKKA